MIRHEASIPKLLLVLLLVPFVLTVVFSPTHPLGILVKKPSATYSFCSLKAVADAGLAPWDGNSI